MIHVSALVHPHPDVAALRGLLVAQLGFVALDGQPGVVENGSLRLHLRHGEAPAPLRLEVVTRELEATRDRLCADPAWAASGEVATPSPEWRELSLSHPLGVELLLRQHLDEDQRDALPPLVTELEWEADALASLQRILREVPLDFRDGARVRAVARAEYRAVAAGLLCVDARHALQGLVDVTPAFQHPLLGEAIDRLGLDPAPLFAAREPS